MIAWGGEGVKGQRKTGVSLSWLSDGRKKAPVGQIWLAGAL
jgi:hypothetical protein